MEINVEARTGTIKLTFLGARGEIEVPNAIVRYSLLSTRMRGS